MYKRLLSVLLAMFLVISLAACAGETTTTGTPGETTTAADDTDTTEPSGDAIQITVGLPEIVNANFAEGEDMTDNLWTRKFKEDHNVEVIVEWVSAEYETNLNLAITAGNLPDAFTCNPVQLNQLAEAGQLEDLQAAYDNYAGTTLKRMMENNWDIVETGMFDGELLALPRLHYGYETSTPHIWARKDWTDELGIEDLSTFSDLEAMMDAFMTEYDIPYGIMLDRSLGTFYQLSPAFHAYPRIWVEADDGSIVYGSTLPETKNALEKWAEWYADGYIRSDFTTLDFPAMLEDAYNGRVGVYAQQNWAGWQVGADMVNNQNEDAYFMSLSMPTVDGAKIMYPVTFPNNVYNVIRKGYEHPEVLVKLINTYIHVLDESLVEGTMEIDEVLPFNTNDMHHITGPFKVEFDHYRDIIEVSTAVRTGEEVFNSGNAYLFYTEIMKYLNDGDLVGLGRYIQMGDEKSSLVRAIKHIDDEHILRSKLWGVPPQALRDFGSTLDDLLVEGFTKIISGEEDISYYDTLIDAWRTAGGDQVTAAINEMYGN